MPRIILEMKREPTSARLEPTEGLWRRVTIRIEQVGRWVSPLGNHQLILDRHVFQRGAEGEAHVEQSAILLRQEPVSCTYRGPLARPVVVHL